MAVGEVGGLFQTITEQTSNLFCTPPLSTPLASGPAQLIRLICLSKEDEPPTDAPPPHGCGELGGGGDNDNA